MTENEAIIDGVRYVARKAASCCAGCSGLGNAYLCHKLPGCSSIIWQATSSDTDELTSLRELNRELVEGLEYCVKNVPEFSDVPGIASVLAKARGEK